MQIFDVGNNPERKYLKKYCQMKGMIPSERCQVYEDPLNHYVLCFLIDGTSEKKINYRFFCFFFTKVQQHFFKLEPDTVSYF